MYTDFQKQSGLVNFVLAGLWLARVGQGLPWVGGWGAGVVCPRNRGGQRRLFKTLTAIQLFGLS